MKSLETARQEAITWAITLRERDDAEVMDAFLIWLSAKEDNARAWGEMERLYLATGSSTPLTDANEPEPKQTEAVVPREFQADNTRVRSSLRAIVLAVAGLFAMTLFINIETLLINLRADHVTANGVAKRITLEDGSAVELSAGTALRVDIKATVRSVELLKGTALFEVAPDQSRPFTVRHQDVAIDAVGTAFEVRGMSQSTSVAVSEGAVDVANVSTSTEQGHRSGSRRLTAGQQLLAEQSPNQLPQPTKIANADVAAWRNGRLIVRNWHAKDVLSALRRHYQGTVVLGTWSLREHRLTAVYDVHQPERALRIFAASQGLKLRKIAGGTLLLSGM